MSTAQEAIVARRDAVDQLRRLLQTSDDLAKVHPLLEEYRSQRQATKEQLRSALAANVERIQAGLESLARAQQALARFETSFSAIDALCTECGSLVDCHEDTRRLAAVHANLRQTLHSCETVANLPQQAADAEMLLGDKSAGLLHAYVCLAELEATAVRVQQALDAMRSMHPGQPSQLPSLASYFSQVHQAMTKVEERVWSTIRQFRTLATKNPAQLVAALQAVEVQEEIDAQLLAAGQGGSKLRKGWRHRCMQQLAASIQESFALLLQRCSKLVAADGHAEEILEDVLAGAGSLIKELQSLKGAIVPCFPPHYGIMAYVGGEYLAQLDNLIDLVGLASGQLSNGQILKVMCWLQEYQTSLLDLSSAGGGAAGKGNGRMTRDSADVTSGGAALLMDTYLGRVSGTLDSWLKNIVETDFSCEPRQAADGKLWTPGPVDLFRILDEQLSVAAQAGGPLLALVAGEAARTLRSFQQASQARLDKGGQPLEVLCAVANNSQRCQVLGEEFAAAAERLMGTSSAEQIYEVHAACKAFPELGNAAVIGCAHVVFSDPGFGELFGRVACTDAWLTGTVTGSILATLDDFFQDFEQWLQRPLYMRMVERVMEECVSHFLAATLTQLRMVRNEDLTALRRDVTKLTAFFGAMLDEGITTVSCQPLADMCEFLNSDSVEAFVLSYTTLLESAPGITPVLLSNLLTARVASHQDMTKADAKEVLEACREVYSAGQGRLPASTPILAAKGRSVIAIGRDTPFLAALNAARRKPMTIR